MTEFGKDKVFSWMTIGLFFSLIYLLLRDSDFNNLFETLYAYFYKVDTNVPRFLLFFLFSGFIVYLFVKKDALRFVLQTVNLSFEILVYSKVWAYILGTVISFKSAPPPPDFTPFTNTFYLGLSMFVVLFALIRYVLNDKNLKCFFYNLAGIFFATALPGYIYLQAIIQN